ncbi:MAG: hypothetical protein INH41_06190 [Myxococcaceae bacterium]|nr:hypothetical protein [Myxococcaceae bacterium]MCA3011977.1 hypothetical protein [Myxococcaceae bacterium]
MLAMMLTALTLAAGDWTVTFTPEETASSIDRPNAAVLVVSGGEQSPSTLAAASAVARALTASGKTRLVMTQESLAVLPQDSDAALVKKAQVLPVDLVLVVRTFPGAAELAVCTVYDRSATAVSAVSGTLGQPLVPRAVRLTAIAGRTTVGDALRESPKATEPSRDHITFGRNSTLNLKSGAAPSAWVTPLYKGEQLEGARFYEVVGRADLARQYRQRTAVKVVTVSLGGIAMLAGSLAALADLSRLTGSSSCLIYDAATARCLRSQSSSLLVPGLGVAAGGLVALLVGVFIEPHPVGTRERYDFVSGFNERVDREKGAKSSAPGPAVEVQVAVVPTPVGVSASLALAF